MAQYGERIARWASAAAPTLRIPPRRRPDAETGPAEPVPTPSRFGRALDFLSDLAVLAFASWTLIAYAGMATEARATLLVAVWLATIPPLGVALFFVSRRFTSEAARAPAARSWLAPLATRHRGRVVAASIGAGLLAALVAAVVATEVWAVVWIGAFAAVVVAVLMGRLHSEEEEAEPEPVPGWPAHAFAAFVGFGFGVMSLFISRPNGDDAFYVNRATGTAELNRIPVRDIIFTDEKVGPVSGTGLPVDSFSALQGAIARFIDVHAASVAYYLTPPVWTFFATWALWRLLRSWAPRNVVLCFALGCFYLVFSAQSALTPGSYFLNRMWQGKVIFVAWLVLTVYVFLTRWLTRRDLRTAVLLVAAGICSIGLTASAAFVAPLIFGTAALPLLLRRDWRGLPVLVAAAFFPFVVGLAATLKYPLVPLFRPGQVRTDRFLGTSWYFHEVFGLGVLAALSLTALWAAPWLARSGAAARLTTSIALVAVLLLAPELFQAINRVSGLTTVLRRVLWFVPLPPLVGLLAAVPVLDLLRRRARAPAWTRRLAVAAIPLAIAALLVVFGRPLWMSWRAGEALWTAEPTWKIHNRALKNARAILRRYEGDNSILVNERTMRALGLITLHPRPVNARGFYARLTPEPRRRTGYRLALTRFVEGEGQRPPREKVERALADLDVGLICVKRSLPRVISEVESLPNYREAFEVRGLVCFRDYVP